MMDRIDTQRAGFSRERSDSPVHRVVQVSFWMACPSQGSPPLRGAGLVQLRVRFWKPRPQRLLHTDHSVHVDQPPLTVATGSNFISLVT